MQSALRGVSSSGWAAFGAVAALASYTAFVRLPFVSNAGLDEVFYLIVGQRWLEGYRPYADAFDVKPPLLFALTALAEWLIGPSLLAAKALGMAAVSATASALYLFGCRAGEQAAGILAALFYIACSVTLGGTFSPAELLMAPFTAFGVVLALPLLLGTATSGMRPPLAAGLCFGAAVCVKQTAIFEAAALAALLAFAAPKAGRTLAMFSVGFCLVPACFALRFANYGSLNELFISTIVLGAARAGAAPVPWPDALLLFSADLVPILPIVIMAVAGLASGWRRGGARLDPVARLLAFWSVAALAGALAARAMLAIYMLPVLQPLCLAAAVSIERAVRPIQSAPRKAAARSASLSCVALYSLCTVAPLMFAGSSNLSAAGAVVTAMRAAGLQNGDAILVADRDLLVYLLSGARPPSTVFHPMHLLCDFPLPGQGNRLAEALDSHPSFIVVADPPFLRDCEKSDRRALLERRIDNEYCGLGRFEGTLTGTERARLALYGLRSRFQPQCGAAASQGIPLDAPGRPAGGGI